jgi:hypothetical protein
MATLLNRLFPSRTRTARRAAKGRTPAKTQLGVETLDARVMPSVTSVLNRGVLTITADGHNTNAYAIQTAGTISVFDYSKGWVGNYATSAVNKIVYNGGLDATKTYNFKDATDRPTTFNVGFGGGAIYGGHGPNTFNANVISHATLFAGTGTNLLNRNGAPAVLQDVDGVTSGPKLTFGLIPGTPTPDQLAATGNLAASLSGNAVTINGPSGIGFQLLGHWIDMVAPNGSHTFTAYDGVTLHTVSGLRDIVLKTGAPVTVTTQGLGLGVDGGELASISWAGIPLNSDDPTSPFRQLGSQYGLSVSTGGTNWGIKLGGDLGSLGVPLNPGVPYLYYSSTSGNGVSFGNVTVSPSNSQSFSVAVDPADPSVMVESNGFGFGASLKGEIPYIPTNLPDGIADPRIYGNVYFTGSVDLGELPASVTGSVVIDLDANNDGRFCGLTRQTLQGVLNGKTSLTAALGAEAGDIKVGLNGELDFSLDRYGINVSAPVGQGSAFFTPASGSAPALLAFREQSVNPFAGTVLEQFTQPSTSFDLQGWVNSSSQWAFKAEAGTGEFLGFKGKSLELDSSSASQTVHAHVSLGGMLGRSEVDLDGTVNWQTGDFDLTQTAMFQLDAKVCSFYMFDYFDLSNHNGVVAMNVLVEGVAAIGSADANVHASVMGDLAVTEDSSGKVNVAGSASASVGVTVGGTSYDTPLAGFKFNNQGFSIDILGHDAQVNW